MRNNAALAVKRRQQILHVQQDGLDLHDQQRPCGRVPSNDVDGSTLAIVAEGVLRDRLPPAIVEEAHHCLDEPRVAGIEEARNVRGRHARRELQGYPDRIGDPTHRGEGETAAAA